MTTDMQKQHARASRILRRFSHYVKEAAAADGGLDTPTIARTKPHAWARIKRSVAWRLMAKGAK